MERNEACLTNTCSFAGVKPIMVDLSYPPIQVRRENPAYANLLGMDYCGPVSELSAITQYINNENAFPAKNVRWQRHFWELGSRR